MKYNEALEYINDKDKFGSRPGLTSIGKLLDLLGNPQESLNCIHIAGTNGKGSTASFLSNALIQAGYRVGLFSSPYIERFNERIQVNGVDIADDELGRLTEIVKDKADTMLEEGYEYPTTFEIVTAIAFIYFRERRVDYLVLEVGLGGRYDSTNIINSPLISVITTIDYDHLDRLGHSLDKIAFQKGGIIKKNSLAVSCSQKYQAMRVLKDIAYQVNAKLYLSSLENIKIREISSTGTRFDFKYKDYIIENIRINMLGEYQVYNASLALTTLFILRENGLISISDSDMLTGLEKTKWPGRLEVLGENPCFLIDGAHNVQGIHHLKKALKLFSYKRLILGVGLLKDKDTSKMIEDLAPIADLIIATEVNMPRKLDAVELGNEMKKHKANVYVEKDIKSALKSARELANTDDMIVFCGSLYLIGEVRNIFKLL